MEPNLFHVSGIFIEKLMRKKNRGHETRVEEGDDIQKKGLSNYVFEKVCMFEFF